MKKKYKIILVIALVIILLFFLFRNNNFNTSNGYTIKDNHIHFKLYNMKNEILDNTNWEYSEQLLMEKYLHKNDNILQLGGNIGASCIMADKILNKNNTNICVEPNAEIINTLDKNKKYTNSNFTIIKGIITEEKNLKLFTDNDSIDTNFWGSTISKNKGININSFKLNTIPNINKINVLFADCEGCLEKFLDEYEFFLSQLRLIIYETDQAHMCDYNKIESILSNNKFNKIEVSGQMCVWTK